MLFNCFRIAFFGESSKFKLVFQTISATCHFPDVQSAVDTTVQVLQCGIPMARIGKNFISGKNEQVSKVTSQCKLTRKNLLLYIGYAFLSLSPIPVKLI